MPPLRSQDGMPAAPDTRDKVAANLRVADRYVMEVLNGRSLQPLSDLLTQDFEYNGPMTTIHGREAYIEFMRDLWTAWTDWRIVVTAIRTTANTAILEHDFSATHSAPYFGIPAAGQRFTVSGHMSLRFRSGLIASLAVSYNTTRLMAQLGVGA